MNSLNIIKKFLDGKNIKNDMDILPNGKTVLVAECRSGEFSLKRNICIEQPIENDNSIRVYCIITNVSTDAKRYVCQIINDYNRKYNFIKFFYQESMQGAFLFASYGIPALDSGLENFFEKILNTLLVVADDVALNIPAAAFLGEVKPWLF